jgi:hypothetical protein
MHQGAHREIAGSAPFGLTRFEASARRRRAELLQAKRLLQISAGGRG